MDDWRARLAALQGSLFGQDDAARPLVARSAEQLARPTDPETSLDAAATVVPTLREIQQNVLCVFERERKLTHEQLIHCYRARFEYRPDSSIRTRCAELVDAGFLKDSGERVRLASGRMAVVWQLCEQSIEP